MFAGGKATFDTGASVKLLVIDNHTVPESKRSSRDARNWEQLKLMIPKLSDETLRDFETKRNKVNRLNRSFETDLTYILVKTEDLKHLPNGSQEDWVDFYTRYPDSGGYVSFSRVGFNKEMTQALMYMEHGCRVVCGTGHYLLLQKCDGSWIVSTRFMSWIS